ncbi:MAG: hypothetical protein B7Z73_13335 [Planctomycetia bacterium 21-64-5]|nr:MAG: hypothetical protein B7Z73_13335 [Planctomycetia bacterium 21-64-5]HQU42734.1 hypothetical protein [Pirellulales bacterium]
MLTKLVLATLVVGGLAAEVRATDTPVSVKTQPVVWRGGYRFRSYPARTGNFSAYRGSGSYGNRGWTGRTSPLDYPPWTQPYVTRTNQWNKYPNQPYYLRGERKSLLILP